MKKFLYLLVTMVMAFAFNDASAQIYPLKSTSDKAIDTVTDTGTEHLTARVVGEGKAISVQLTVTKLTGTVDGAAFLYGTIDGTNYAKISSDSLDITNVATQSKIWTISGHPCISYRVVVTGAGSSTYTIEGQVLRRRE